MKSLIVAAALFAASAHVAAHLYDQPDPSLLQPAPHQARAAQPQQSGGFFPVQPAAAGYPSGASMGWTGPVTVQRMYYSYSIGGVNGAPIRQTDLKDGGLGFMPVEPGNGLPGNPSRIDPPIAPHQGPGW